MLKTISLLEFSFQKKKNMPIGTWVYSAFFLNIFSQALLLSHDSWQSQSLSHLCLSGKKNATLSADLLALASAFGEGAHRFGVEEHS